MIIGDTVKYRGYPKGVGIGRYQGVVKEMINFELCRVLWTRGNPAGNIIGTEYIPNLEVVSDEEPE